VRREPLVSVTEPRSPWARRPPAVLQLLHRLRSLPGWLLLLFARAWRRRPRWRL